MQYNDFIKLRRVGAVAVLGLAIIGGFLACNRPQQKVDTSVSQQPTEVNPPPVTNTTDPAPPTDTTDTPVATSDSLTLTDIHKEILRLQQQPLTSEGAKNSGDGIQWRVKDNGVTVEFRSDTSKGSTTWNRAKVDYNGNKKYEERWDFKGETVRRRVAPTDDENYTEEYNKNGEQWVKK
jgi:hypothetical protein